jgi:Cd2+/Zn2+-exporting ATPase
MRRTVKMNSIRPETVRAVDRRDARRQDDVMSERAHGTEHEAPGEWQKLAFLAAVSGGLGLLSLVADQFGDAGRVWALILIAGSCVAGGWDAAIDGWAALRERRIDVHLLMIVVAVGAWIVGAQWEGALLLFLFSTAGAIEHYAMDRTRGAIDALLDKSPKHARRLGPDDSETEVPVSALLPGDRIAILPGELVPADGKVLSGESAVDESNLTGEAKPAPKQAGSDVAGGTLNSWGRLIVEVTRAERDSALQRIVRLIREAQDSKAPAQRAIDKWGDAYAIFTLSASALFFLYLQITAPDGVREASPLYRAMTLLVVLSPCALVLSVPSAVLAAIAAGARQGILFRGGAAVERLADVDCICFDKTGTLTAGIPELAALEVYPEGPGRLRALSALLTLESSTTHPFAAGVVSACLKEGASQLPVQGLSNSPGQGVSGTVAGTRWSVGTREFVGGGTLPPATVAEGAIVSEVWASDGTVTVRATLVDRIRDESRSTLTALHARKIRTVMLTGDREEAAVVAARQVGIQSYAAALTPDAKMAAIRRYSAEGHVVAMVGDGVNDAPSLAAADVAIGMGGRGSDAALESSDLVLTDDRIGRLVDAIELSRSARMAIRFNVLISVGAALGMAAYVIFRGAPLPLAISVHEGSTIVVCLNGLRLLAHRPRR